MSTRRVKKEVGLPKHTHCKNCGVSIPYDGREYCGPECDIDYTKWKRREQYKTIGMIVIMGIVVAWVFLTNVLMG